MDLISLITYIIYFGIWLYAYCIIYFFIGLTIISFAYKCTPIGTKINYYLYHGVIWYTIVLATGILTPILMFRPRNVMNARLAAWFIRKASYIVGMTWELRGANIAGINEGAVICSNHQSANDIFGELCQMTIKIDRKQIDKTYQ